jgi:stearoyl-CoA desaturase (delta-9 desaturase)
MTAELASSLVKRSHEILFLSSPLSSSSSSSAELGVGEDVTGRLTALPVSTPPPLQPAATTATLNGAAGAGSAVAVATDPRRGEPAAPPQPMERVGWRARLLTAAVVVAPLGVFVLAVDRFWHHGIGWFDLGLGFGLYVATGLGISLGFHRHFTHRSFRACRWLRITLAVGGSMAAEGSVISWVANHRRHHVYADRSGDPHSPWTVASGPFRRLRGLFHAHVGWLFSSSESSPGRWCRDLLADRDVVVISKLAPLWMALSLMLPFAIGWAVTRSLTGAVLALLWAGILRMALLHHVTWSINSLAHVFGERRYANTDRSGNVAWLSILSFGESWHNSHHAFPALARHGCDPHQPDPSAAVLRVFEHFGWVSHVRWSTPAYLARVRKP